MSSTTATVQAQQKSGGGVHDHPVSAIAIGLFILFFGLWGVTTQLWTSEAGYTAQHVALTFMPHFSIFGQLIDFWNGNLNQTQLMSFTYAWGVQIFQFVASLGIEWPKHNKFFIRIFWAVTIITIVLNSLADYFFAANAIWYQQVGFTLVCFGMSFGLIHGALYLIIRKGIVALFIKR